MGIKALSIAQSFIHLLVESFALSYSH